eukprot:140928_1
MSYQHGSYYNKRGLEISLQTRYCSWKCTIKSQICLNLIQLYYSWILQHQYSIKIVVEYSQPNTHKTFNVGHVRNGSDCGLYNLDNTSNFSQTTIDNPVSALAFMQQARDEHELRTRYTNFISYTNFTPQHKTETIDSIWDASDSQSMIGGLKMTNINEASFFEQAIMEAIQSINVDSKVISLNTNSQFNIDSVSEPL